MNGTGDQNINRRGLDGAIVRQYLLDELASDARERLEERLMTEDELFAQLLELEDEQEDELIDQYVHDHLSAAERERFERIFLSTPERQEKLNLVRDLKAQVTSPALHARGEQKGKKKKGPGFSSFLAFFRFQNPLVGFSLAAALLLVVAGSVWFFSRVSRLESEVSRLKAEGQVPAPAPDQGLRDELARMKARNDELEASLRQTDEERSRLNEELAALKSHEKEAQERPARTPPPRQEIPVLSLILPLIRSKGAEGGQGKQLELPAGPSRVRLLLDLDVIDPDDYKSYRAVIQRRDGSVVWRDNSPAVFKVADQSQIVVSPPANLLHAGEYVVELSGLPTSGPRTPVGTYTFRVTKK